MEYLLCIYYLNYLAMFHINFVISIQACTNLTTAITRVCVLPKSRRTVFMAVPGSPWFPTGGPRSLPRPFIHSTCVARRRHRRHSRDPQTVRGASKRRCDARSVRVESSSRQVGQLCCALTGRTAVAGRGDAALSNGRQHVNRPLLF